uniref:SWIM-type domain-containing protein n=1 Tax=Romanomermis culicivorax TaxID=13658 RepID=A0A915L9J9_ROMCU
MLSSAVTAEDDVSFLESVQCMIMESVGDGHSLSPGCKEIARVDAIRVDADLHRHLCVCPDSGNLVSVPVDPCPHAYCIIRRDVSVAILINSATQITAFDNANVSVPDYWHGFYKHITLYEFVIRRHIKSYPNKRDQGTTGNTGINDENQSEKENHSSTTNAEYCDDRHPCAKETNQNCTRIIRKKFQILKFYGANKPTITVERLRLDQNQTDFDALKIFFAINTDLTRKEQWRLTPKTSECLDSS